jgi:hypothetical protein
MRLHHLMIHPMATRRFEARGTAIVAALAAAAVVIILAVATPYLSQPQSCSPRHCNMAVNEVTALATTAMMVIKIVALAVITLSALDFTAMGGIKVAALDFLCSSSCANPREGRNRF